MEMNSQYKLDDFELRLMEGLKLAYQRMIIFKKQKNSVIVMMRDGKIVYEQPD